MTKKRHRPESEQYHYWQGQLDPTHPWVKELADNLAHKFWLDQVSSRQGHGGLTKMVYWFLQDPGSVPKYPIRLTLLESAIRAPNDANGRFLAAYLLQASWPTIIRRVCADHLNIIHTAEPIDPCPKRYSFKDPPVPNWVKDLAYSRKLLDKMTLNYQLEPIERLRSIRAQTEHLRYLIKPNNS